MKLRCRLKSPRVRKVLVVAHETGLINRLELAITPKSPQSGLTRDNPLDQIPTLVTDDGTAIFDSVVICEYLDSLWAGPKLFPSAVPLRWVVLTNRALADGLTDSAIFCVSEARKNKAQQSEELIAAEKQRIERGLDRLEAIASGWQGNLAMDQISTAVALGYLDFRFSADRWREKRPVLTAWFERFASRPSMQKTIATDD